MLTLFYETSLSAGAIPIADIEKIGYGLPNTHGVIIRKVKLRSGTEIETRGDDAGGLITKPVQLIPAQPGITMVRVWLEGPRAQVREEPVIAWALCVDTEVRVVTPNGVNGGGCRWDGDYYVKMPDGRIEAVGEWTDPCAFADLDAMVRHHEERARSPAPESPQDGTA